MNTDRRTWFRRAILPALVLPLLVACSDDSGDGDVNGPTGSIDPQQSQALLDSVVNSFVDDNESLNSLGGVGSFITQITGQPSIVSFDVSSSESAGGLSPIRREIWRTLEVWGGDGRGGLATANIPDNLLGVTCIWDLQRGAYVDDPGRTEAPQNGIRFVLYTPDPGTGLPASPLNEIGHIDIVDLSSGSTIDVSMQSLVGGVALLDYGVGGSVSDEVNFSLSMPGFLGDGSDRLDFLFTAVSSSTVQTLAYDITLGTIAIDLSVTSSQSGEASLTATLTDTGSGDYVAFSINFDADGNVISGSGVLFNGQQVATISGSTAGVTISAVEGSGLGTAEVQAMAGIFGATQDLFFVLFELLDFGIGNTGGQIIVN